MSYTLQPGQEIHQELHLDTSQAARDLNKFPNSAGQVFTWNFQSGFQASEFSLKDITYPGVLYNQYGTAIKKGQFRIIATEEDNTQKTKDFLLPDGFYTIDDIVYILNAALYITIPNRYILGKSSFVYSDNTSHGKICLMVDEGEYENPPIDGTPYIKLTTKLVITDPTGVATPDLLYSGNLKDFHYSQLSQILGDFVTQSDLSNTNTTPKNENFYYISSLKTNSTSIQRMNNGTTPYSTDFNYPDCYELWESTNSAGATPFLATVGTNPVVRETNNSIEDQYVLCCLATGIPNVLFPNYIFMHSNIADNAMIKPLHIKTPRNPTLNNNLAYPSGDWQDSSIVAKIPNDNGGNSWQSMITFKNDGAHDYLFSTTRRPINEIIVWFTDPDGDCIDWKGQNLHFSFTLVNKQLS